MFIPQAKFHNTEALLRSAVSHAAVDNFTSQSINRVSNAVVCMYRDPVTCCEELEG